MTRRQYCSPSKKMLADLLQHCDYATLVEASGLQPGRLGEVLAGSQGCGPEAYAGLLVLHASDVKKREVSTWKPKSKSDFAELAARLVPYATGGGNLTERIVELTGISYPAWSAALKGRPVAQQTKDALLETAIKVGLLPRSVLPQPEPARDKPAEAPAKPPERVNGHAPLVVRPDRVDDLSRYVGTLIKLTREQSATITDLQRRLAKIERDLGVTA